MYLDGAGGIGHYFLPSVWCAVMPGVQIFTVCALSSSCQDFIIAHGSDGSIVFSIAKTLFT